MSLTARLSAILAAAALGLSAASLADAQSRIRTMPGYERWAEMSPQIPRTVKSGAINALWAADSQSFEYVLEGKRWRFDLASLSRTEIEPRVTSILTPAPGAAPPAVAAATGPLLARGRGRDADVLSPDGKTRAISRDHNIFLVASDTGAEQQITADGGTAARIRHGVGSYLYLEEFSVSQPVWWSPDGKKLAWMRYDETQVGDYFLQLDQTKTLSTVLTAAYPHPGTPNPVADLMVFDLASGVTTRMDVREGSAFTDEVVGHYVWAAEWTKDSTTLLVRRADRLQKHYDLAACLVATSRCRTVVRESRPGSWAQGAAPRFLEDGKRFLWISERNDFRNLYLYDLTGTQLSRITRGDFDVVDVVRIDEKAGWIWYTARSGDNHMLVQLHRVRLDGAGDRRLTDPSLSHRIDLSPDGRHFVDVAQAHDKAPASSLRDMDGKLLGEIALSDISQFMALGFRPAELFTFTSADGQSELHGQLQFPSDFDPAKTYPMLLYVYGGPASSGLSETFANPTPLAEYGFLIVRLDARTNSGRGRKMLDATYKQLGIAEMDDFAAGLRSLWRRPYVDPGRVGIYGTSYGGTVAATVLLRHPDVVQAAVANSPVTDYRLYDSAYSERHLGLPGADPDAYDRAAVLSYAHQLRGDLLIYYGTSDDNVHPKNALQLIKALQAAGKSFEVQVGPDKGHTGLDQTRMMEFFIQHLVLGRTASLRRSGPATGPNADPG
jgi:dipeptidyl-peptidase-4